MKVKKHQNWKVSNNMAKQDSIFKPRVLYLTKVYPYPPATAGDAVYSKGIIEALSNTCQVTVICADSGAIKKNTLNIDWRIVSPQRSGRVGSILSTLPLIAWKCATHDYTAMLESLLEKDWDAIILDNLGLAHALPRVKLYRDQKKNTQLIYISHEYEYSTRKEKYNSYKMAFPKKFLAEIDLKKVFKSEKALLIDCDVVTVINTLDIDLFRKVSSDKKYLPLIPGYDGPIIESRNITSETPRRVLLLGGRKSEQKRQILIDWMKLAYDALTREGIEIVIVGDMDDKLQNYLISNYSKVQVLGFVEDLEKLIASARIGLIVDTVGGGFKLRLLTHVFERLPIVGLDKAINGLPTLVGEGYLGASNLQSLTSLICKIIDDVDRLNDLQETAFVQCLSAFSWKSRADSLVSAVKGNVEYLV